MHAAEVWTALGGIVAAATIVGTLIKISYQIGGFTAELRAWRLQIERRVNGLESAVYLPRHRQHK